MSRSQKKKEEGKKAKSNAAVASTSNSDNSDDTEPAQASVKHSKTVVPDIMKMVTDVGVHLSDAQLKVLGEAIVSSASKKASKSSLNQD